MPWCSGRVTGCVCLCVCVHSDLKVHGDGRSGPFLLIVGRQQLDLSADLRFLHPGHAFDPTDDSEGGGFKKQYIIKRI